LRTSSSDVPESFLTNQRRVRITSHSSQGRVRVIQNFFESSQSRVMTWSSRVRVNTQQMSSHWFASSNQCRVK